MSIMFHSFFKKKPAAQDSAPTTSTALQKQQTDEFNSSPNVDALHDQMIMLYSQLDTINIDPSMAPEPSVTSTVSKSLPPTLSVSTSTTNIHVNPESAPLPSTATAHSSTRMDKLDSTINDDEIDTLYQTIRNQQEIPPAHIPQSLSSPPPSALAELNELRQDNSMLKTALTEYKQKLKTLESNAADMETKFNDMKQKLNHYQSLFDQAHVDNQQKHERIRDLEQDREELRKQMETKDKQIQHLLTHQLSSPNEERYAPVVDTSQQPLPSQVINIERKMQDQLEKRRGSFQNKIIAMEREMKQKDRKVHQLSETLALQKIELQQLQQQQVQQQKQNRRRSTTISHQTAEGGDHMIGLDAMQLHVHHLKSLFLQHVHGSSVELVDTVAELSHKLSYWTVLRDVYEDTVQELIKLAQMKDL